MTMGEQVIWETFLMRRDRDLEWLWQKAQERDPLGCKFFDGFGAWLEKVRKAPADKAPQCLTCEQTFCDAAHPPLTYLVTHSEDPRVNVLILTGVCWRCAEKSDAELLKRGSESTAKFLKGYVLSACHFHYPSSAKHH